jgi:tol-pal system protein YbgF
MTLKTFLWICAALPVIFITGCESLGTPNTRNVIYDTNKRVRKLDEGLGASVNKLTETTATLMARMNENDAQMRQLRTMTEENQTKLNALSKDVSDMKRTIYQRIGVSVAPGASMPSSTEAIGGVSVEPPTVPGGTAPRTAPPLTGTLPPAAPATMPTEAPMAGGTEASTLYADAQKTWEARDYTGALQKFSTFLEKYPTHESSANAQFWKAACLLNLNKNQEAAQEFEKLRANYPSSNKVPVAMRSQAVALSRLGQVEQSTKLLEDVVANYPRSPVADQAKKDLEKLKGPAAVKP